MRRLNLAARRATEKPERLVPYPFTRAGAVVASPLISVTRLGVLRWP